MKVKRVPFPNLISGQLKQNMIDPNNLVACIVTIKKNRSQIM